MAAVSLFWGTNMAAVMSCENTLYDFKSRSFRDIGESRKYDHHWGGIRRENPCGKREENMPFSCLSVPSVRTEARTTYNKRINTTKQWNSRENSVFWFPCFFSDNCTCRKFLSVSVSPLTWRSFQMKPWVSFRPNKKLTGTYFSLECQLLIGRENY